MKQITQPPHKLTEIASACKVYCFSLSLNANPQYWRR